MYRNTVSNNELEHLAKKTRTAAIGQRSNDHEMCCAVKASTIKTVLRVRLYIAAYSRPLCSDSLWGRVEMKDI